MRRVISIGSAAVLASLHAMAAQGIGLSELQPVPQPSSRPRRGSRYMPHQGNRERARRLRRLELAGAKEERK